LHTGYRVQKIPPFNLAVKDGYGLSTF